MAITREKKIESFTTKLLSFLKDEFDLDNNSHYIYSKYLEFITESLENTGLNIINKRRRLSKSSSPVSSDSAPASNNSTDDSHDEDGDIIMEGALSSTEIIISQPLQVEDIMEEKPIRKSIKNKIKNQLALMSRCQILILMMMNSIVKVSCNVQCFCTLFFFFLEKNNFFFNNKGAVYC